MKLRVRRKPIEIIVERWDGPGQYVIPEEHSLHLHRMIVEPDDYIAKPSAGDWYPLAADVLASTFDIIGPADDAAEQSHDFSGQAGLCRNCGSAASGSCRGYVPICPACKQPAAWGTASLYFMCLNRGQNCPMQRQTIWLQTRRDRWDGDAP